MRKHAGLIVFLTGVLAAVAFAAEAPPKPLVRAHAHNDYLHARPLLDALDMGFCSVEADINLVDGKLLVAHELKSVKPDRTLESLYLDPLRERVKTNNGKVYPNGPAFTLLIDIKTDGQTTYPVLHRTLEKYADMLTEYRDGKVTPRAVTVIVDNADEYIAAQLARWAFIDGHIADLDANPPAVLTPWISASWNSVFSWKGVGDMPDAERAKLRNLVEKAHAQGRKIRFWGLPTRPAVWEELYAAGVDLINIDDLKAGRDFLLKKGE